MNPFDLYDIDPCEGPAAITKRMREHIERADSDDERDQIRADWEALTLDPRRRLELAFGAFPDTRPDPGRPPRPASRLNHSTDLELADLVPFPSIARALSLEPFSEVDLPTLELADDPALVPRKGSD